MLTENFSNQPSFILLFPPTKTPLISSSLSQFLFSLFKASFPFWQHSGLRLDTLWYKQESDRGHYCPQRTSIAQVLEVHGKRPSALPTLPVPEDGGMGALQAPLISYSSLGLGPSHPAATAPSRLVFNLWVSVTEGKR